MANKVQCTHLGIEINLERDDLGNPGMPGLWERLYERDRVLGAMRVPVSERGMQCAGICRQAGVVAWMYLREQGGRRQAVHERAEDEARHSAPMSDEHKAYQERIIHTAEEAGFHADSEVRTPIGRRQWIQTDTLVEGDNGRRIGWEVQLSTAAAKGPRSVQSRAKKATTHGITPAWHTDRDAYARRNDTQWTYSNQLPARVIAKTGGLRVVSGFRVLDFWRCDITADLPCPDGLGRCWKQHATPKPRDVLFDDLVRKTAAGLILPLEYWSGSRMQRFWVPADERDRYYDAFGQPSSSGEIAGPRAGRGSSEGPTCRPRTNLATTRRVLDWRDQSHWSFDAKPCKYCQQLTNLVDDAGTHMHKVCREATLGADAA
ncbi:hypothetical protein KVH02_33225 [Streptomyces olivaceus]|uniref:Uncharacterized protein n=1 Tax=Streptomyces olivaceus TaxID=47716 RepID=A0ABS7WDF2_STROV|nr:hypothetical protein [Streptomyces olivaceus]MBZ6093139.1 hypothetical protein [Streptomyces olivaceus]MBZ6100239.1 hypothetical protein [Streptomyces olivaceus]MBZ6121305.1 hypothetical protein [Streptomyces olivaceus]MBZ6155972.1 hypothetical protein [Streptomyces olivaceus]MBZ6302584.1 hypothetical protein [Streptomyces olivaceus]